MIAGRTKDSRKHGNQRSIASSEISKPRSVIQKSNGESAWNPVVANSRKRPKCRLCLFPIEHNAISSEDNEATPYLNACRVIIRLKLHEAVPGQGQMRPRKPTNFECTNRICLSFRAESRVHEAPNVIMIQDRYHRYRANFFLPRSRPFHPLRAASGSNPTNLGPSFLPPYSNSLLSSVFREFCEFRKYSYDIHGDDAGIINGTLRK